MKNHAFDAVLIDMDGVLYHGDQVILPALRFVEALGNRPRAFVTNNPILTPQSYVDKLARLGFEPPDARFVITSGLATARHLSMLKPRFRYFAVGAPALHQMLSMHGKPVRENADFVVVGEGKGLDFDSLTQGINLILEGARLINTNPDTTVDAVRDGKRIVVPGGGALVAPFVAATGAEPLVIGKPERGLYDMAMDILGVTPQRCLMIGDRPDTDILGASRLGMRTALVRTGRFGPGEPWPQEQKRPDWDVNGLDELMHLLE
ncbi:MAG: HAD-IIA family hydrolase [Gammaproteobacteria bacterium]